MNGINASENESFAGMVRAASVNPDTWQIDASDNSYELAVLVLENKIPVRFNDLLGYKISELVKSAPGEAKEAILQAIAKSNQRGIAKDVRSEAIKKYPLSFFSNPLIVEEEYKEAFRQLLERMIVNPGQVTSCFDNPAIAKRPEIMAAATKAWDKELVSGADFAKLLANTSETALPRHVLDKLFDLFTDPQNINPPWVEALAMLNNTHLKYSREQVKLLLESSDPELYIAGLENEDNMLTWQEWKKVSTALNQEVSEQFNCNESPLAELYALTERIQHKAQKKIREEKPSLLFSDLELMDWFLMGPDNTAQNVVVDLLIQMGPAEKESIQSEGLLNELKEASGDINSYNLANAAILLSEMKSAKSKLA